MLRRLALSIVLNGVPWGCHQREPDVVAQPPETDDVVLSPRALAAAHIVVSGASEGPRRNTVTAYGHVDFDPRRVARVGPLVEGRVLSVRVEPGQRVALGAVLATVESLEVGRVRSEYVAHTLEQRRADLELARVRTMTEAGAASPRELVAAESERSLAGVALRAATERLRAVGVRSLGGAEGSRPSVVALNTPIEGTVLEVSARLGQAVGATDTLFVVGDRAEVWVLLDVYERDLARVRQGAEARVELLARPGRVFAGQVDHVGGALNPERRAVSVRVVLDNHDGALSPGMSATARILVQLQDRVVRVPRGAVQSIDGQPFVFVERASGRYELRAVERGEDIEGEVEISRGLARAEPVVVQGAFVLKSEVLRQQMGTND